MRAARARRGLKAEAEQLARRGRPPKQPAPAPAPAPGAAPAAPVAPVAGAAPEDQGRQLGLMCRAMTAPLYLAVCGQELPAAAWEEWGVAAAKFAAYYVPNIAQHPGYQFAAASAVLVVPVALSWPGYTRRRAAAIAKAKADAAKAAAEGTTPAVTPATDGKPPAPPAGPLRQPGSAVGGGWGGLRDKPGA